MKENPKSNNITDGRLLYCMGDYMSLRYLYFVMDK